ncbi:hypothetical protein KFL_007930030 [Klebsormidium nitens]|uniref:Uncharacterized protein n=1 Tax=Klebsormidium nitens TaxID=105231 RepID=A0A1Y1IKV5_KLENI|nr:hypothetical protein KFL_007930030 [Klebsormidium nitens]|eukprot:GAQ91480.1 hypothetical protein KFL_007930030 [Klebsormidium nitens]
MAANGGAEDMEKVDTGPHDSQEDAISDWSSEDESPISPLQPQTNTLDSNQAWQPLASVGGEEAGGVQNGGGREFGIAELSNMTVEELGRRLAAGDTLAVSGEQLLNYQPDAGGANGPQVGEMTPDEEEEEERRIAQQEAAIAEANAREEERRRAPLPEEKKEAIVSAMKGFTLKGYKPQWAAQVPDDELVAKVKRRSGMES